MPLGRGSLPGRVCSLCIFIFKKFSADNRTVKTVYYALCQSILNYCITVWGGCPKTTLLPLERAQRAVLKVMTSKPFRYPTAALYAECQVLTVRQLFVLGSILRKHPSVIFGPNATKKRRYYEVCTTYGSRTSLAQRHFDVLSNHLYNRIKKVCTIAPVCLNECKIKVTKWLHTLNYCKTEDLLQISLA